jgi:pimeloyl-ACP methyl ester carboxylesterase
VRRLALTLLFAALAANAAQAANPRPQTPLRPFPYREIDVGYDNPKAPGVYLAGALTLPQAKGPYPAVILITGSGAQDRDESMGGHKPFLILADALTRRGVAVLRVDDRGVGGSLGARPNDTTADFATDVEAGVAFLRTRPDIDARRIGLIGHSEGGEIAPMVAARDPSIAFIVMMAGPAIPGDQIIAAQTRDIALASGAAPAAAESSFQLEKRVLDAVKAAPDDAAMAIQVNAVMRAAGQPDLQPAALQAFRTKWYRDCLVYDPAPALRALKIPVLALIGDKDTQVPAKENIPVLQASLADDPKAEVRVVPGVNHLFQPARTGAPAEYAATAQTIAPEALEMIVGWVAKTAGVAAR